MFDSHSDIAAVVYEAHDDPDRILREFTGGLRRSGCRAAGLIQLGGRDSAAQDRLPMIALSTGKTITLRHNAARRSAGCSLDAGELMQARMRLAVAMTEDADLVIINRFGKLEADGMGFVEEIRQASAADIPVVIAVPEWRFKTWIRFCEGMCVRLPCHRKQLDEWWRIVAGSPRRSRSRDAFTFCEIAK